MQSPLWISRHRSFQEARLDEERDYRIEVGLHTQIEHQGWKVHLHGRADGVVGTPEGSEPWRVEEVKTGLGPWATGTARAEAYSLQAGLYAWMLRRETGREASASVIWLALGAEPCVIPVPWADAEIERRTRAELDQALAEARRREDRRQKRSAAQVASPHETWRAGQPELIEATELAIADGEHLLIEAPTGSGKTAAVLYAACRAALVDDLTVVWATGRRTQQRLPLEILQRIAPSDLPFAVQLRSQESMCTTGVRFCHEEACELAGDPKALGPPLLERMLEGGVLSGAEMRRQGRDADVCPYLLAHAAREEVTVVLADYHHLVDPISRLAGPPGADPLEDAVLIVDEFHQLLDRARAAGSITLPEETIREAIEQAALGSSDHHRAERELCERLLELMLEIRDEAGLSLDGAEVDGEFWIPLELPTERLRSISEELQTLRLQTLIEFGAPGLAGPDPIAEVDRILAELCREDHAPGSLGLLGLVQSQTRLRRFELDPSRRLAPIFSKARAVIGLSATLTPHELHRDGLGLEADRTNVLTVPSPLPPDRQRVVIDPTVDTRYQARGKAVPKIAKRIHEFAEAVPGNCMAVFPSHQLLREVREQLPQSELWIESQQPDDDDGTRAECLARMQTQNDILLLAVAGGIYTEGIDLPGDALLGVVVVGPCLPPPSTERQLLANHLEEQSESGHDHAYAVPGINRVIQAVGRLLRTPEDRGVAALLGQRFLKEPYLGLLPEAWWTDGTALDHTGNAAEVAANFLRREPELPPDR